MSAWRYMDAAGRRSIVAARASAGRTAGEIAREFGCGEGEIIRIAGRNFIEFPSESNQDKTGITASDAAPDGVASRPGRGGGTPAPDSGDEAVHHFTDTDILSQSPPETFQDFKRVVEAAAVELVIRVSEDDLGRLMAIAGAAGRSAAEIAASIVASVLADDAAAHGEGRAA